MSSFAGLIGQWNTTGESVATRGASSIAIRGTDKYEWLPGKHFIIHFVDVWMGDEKVNVIEVIGPLQSSEETIPMHSFDNGGRHTLMHARVNADGTWSFLGADVRSTLSMNEDGSAMAASWERMSEGQWTEWLNVRFVRAT